MYRAEDVAAPPGAPRSRSSTRGGRRWKRTLLYTVLILMVVFAVGAGGAYAWFNGVMNKAHKGPGYQSAVSYINQSKTSTSSGSSGATVTTVVEKPGTTDILVMGSDSYLEGAKSYGRSDTLMLVHVDAQNDYASMLSIPRDLRVNVPGHGMEKINAAYSQGGPALCMQVVEQSTGIKIDHFLNINFDAFRQITTALGGIYVDVDRQYYNPDPTWELINILPGYQRLSGEQALDYVRFRHDQNYDYGRIDRQQRFLRAAKEQALGWNLVVKGPQLVSLLASNVSTDVSTNETLRLLYWAVGLSGSKIKQVYLQTAPATIDGGSYLVSTSDEISAAVHQLYVAPGSNPSTLSPLVKQLAPGEVNKQLTGKSTTTTTATTTTTSALVDLTNVSVEVLNGNGRTGEASLAAGRLKLKGATITKVGDAANHQVDTTIIAYPSGQKSAAALVAKVVGVGALKADDSLKRIRVTLGADFKVPVDPTNPASPGDIPNHDEWKALATKRPFSLMGPGYVPLGYKYKDRRIYDIATDGGPKPALKMVYQFENSDQYLGIMETTFTDAPAALDGEKLTAGGITFTVVSYGGRVDHIWWQKDGVLYWVSNTLSYLLDKAELVKMAESMVTITTPAK